MIMRSVFILLLLVTCTFAGSLSPVFTGNSQAPSEAILEQLAWVGQILVALMATMIVLAGAVYVIGQMFGAETRASATSWSYGMLAAVGVSALVVVVLYIIVPSFLSGRTIGTQSTENIIISLRDTAEMALIGLMAIFFILSAAIYVFGQMFGAETRARASVWATGLLTGAIIAAIIYVILFEILGYFESNLFRGTPLFIYRDVLINVTFFAGIFILITFMLSKIFKIPEWEVYLNVEFSNLMNSFILMVFIIGLFGVGSVIASTYTGGVATTPPQAAISYMRSVVADSVLRALYDVYHIQACTSMLSTVAKRIGEYVLTHTFKVFPGLDTFVSITNVLGFGLVSVYGSISAQLSLLYLVDSTMLHFFLPAGLVLRFFPPTRDAGAFLISLAFGFYMIFPATYMVNKAILDDVAGSGYKYRTPHVLISSLCGPFKYGVWGVLLNPSANPVFTLTGTGGQVVGTFLSRLVSETTLNAVSMTHFIPFMEHLASLSLLALFMPALSMVVTLSFINVMTKFISMKL